VGHNRPNGYDLYEFQGGHIVVGGGSLLIRAFFREVRLLIYNTVRGVFLRFSNR